MMTQPLLLYVLHIWPWVSGNYGYWNWWDRGNQEPAPQRSSSSSGCILDLSYFPVVHLTIAPSQQPAAITLENLGLGHTFYSLIKPNIIIILYCCECLCGDCGLGCMIWAFTFQPRCLDWMWRANTSERPPKQTRWWQKAGKWFSHSTDSSHYI